MVRTVFGLVVFGSVIRRLGYGRVIATIEEDGDGRWELHQ